MEGGSNYVDIPITVAQKQITGITVADPPKIQYIEGNDFDPTGLVITASYDNGKSEDIAYSAESGITFAPTAALSTSDTKVTITYGGKTAEQAIIVTKKSSGGGSIGGSRPSRPTAPTTTDPSIGGSSKSWSNIAADLTKLTTGSEATIELNGNTTVPADVIKTIVETKAVITFKLNNVFSWTVDGSTLGASDIKNYDFQINVITASGTETLRGTVGTGFMIESVTNKATLNINFKTTHVHEFANLYKKVDGKLVFVDNVKIDENGAAVGLEVSEKGEYVVMLGELSDRPGDMDNDGILNAMDSSAVLKDIVGPEPGKNPLMADFNGDGRMNAMDASAILKRIVGLE
ncbi:MAG: dockerin type I domain-containing protein [Oscillospiraceae bacterium]